LLLIAFVCFFIGAFATYLCGNGLLTLFCIIAATVLIYVANSSSIIETLHSAPFGFYVLFEIITWNIIPYAIFFFFPSVAGHLAQLLLKSG
jgi:hypothetical protein